MSNQIVSSVVTFHFLIPLGNTMAVFPLEKTKMNTSKLKV